MDKEKSGSSTLQKRRSDTFWTSSSDISGYHADIHEEHGTVGAGQGRGMACVNYRTAWHVNGMGAVCYVLIGLKRLRNVLKQLPTNTAPHS